MSGEILVVGANGTVGAGVVRGLASVGERVRAAGRGGSRTQDGVTPVRLDLADPATFGAALEGVDRVFLLSPGGVFQADALLAPFVAHAGQRVRKLVVMTAKGVEADEAIPLRKLERLVERTGRAHVVLRPSWFMQNFESFWAGGILARGAIEVPAGDGKSAFVDAADVSAAAVAALRSDRWDGQAVPLTGPAALGYAEAAEVLSRAAGRPIRYAPVEDAPFAAGLRQAGLSPEYAQLLVALFQGVRAGWAAEVADGVERVTGRAPRSLTDYARDRREFFARAGNG